MLKSTKSRVNIRNITHTKCTKLYINISNNGEIISPYSENNKEVINNEFAGFLDNSVKDIPIKQKLSIKITTQNCDINKISYAIKNYYHNESVDTSRKLRHNLISSILTLLIGLIALTTTIIFNTLNIPIILGNTVDIFAWVFVWESVDLFFFRRTELKYAKRRQINFINAIIEENNEKPF